MTGGRTIPYVCDCAIVGAAQTKDNWFHASACFSSNCISDHKLGHVLFFFFFLILHSVCSLLTRNYTDKGLFHCKSLRLCIPV